MSARSRLFVLLAPRCSSYCSSDCVQRLFPLPSATVRQVLSYARRRDAASAARRGFQNPPTREARDGVFSIVSTVAGRDSSVVLGTAPDR